jgi:uncharacterized protein with NRDE domain
MCTLMVFHRCVPGTPLVVGANRDEFVDRPTEGPALRRLDYGGIVSPRDVRAGGTWLGLNAHGLFAAITNRPARKLDPQRRSRGHLVVDVLRARSAAQAIEELENLTAETYNPFNLLVADREQVHAITYREAPRRIELDSPVIVLGNTDPTEPPTAKLSRLEMRAQLAAGASAGTVLEELAEICRSHDGGGDALDDTCVHTDGYGTRSSTLLRMGAANDDTELRYTDQAPCISEYRDFTPLLRALVAGSPLADGEVVMRKIT